MRLPALLALLAVAACSTGPLPPSASLPPGAISAASDPVRSAVLNSAFVFNQPSQATPAARARAAAFVEFMAADYRWNPRWSEFTPIVGLQLGHARAELREALGIAPDAPPQVVVNDLLLAGRALEAGDVAAALAALPQDAFPIPQATVGRLAALPPLPATAAATSLAESELRRIDTDSRNNGGGGSSGGAQP